jgi:hypothetical protein
LGGPVTDLGDDKVYGAVGNLARSGSATIHNAGSTFISHSAHEGNDEPGKENKHRKDNDQSDSAF